MEGQENFHFPTRGKIFSHVWEIFVSRVGKVETFGEPAELNDIIKYWCPVNPACSACA